MKSKQSLLIGLVIAVVVVLLIVASAGRDSYPEEDLTNEITETAALLVDAEYSVVPAESEVRWDGAKKIIVNWSHEGTVDITSGFLEIEDGLLAGGEFVVDMTSIAVDGSGADAKVDDEGLVTHLKSADWFDVETYPEAHFSITAVQSTGSNTFQVEGDLTLKGITQEVSFPAVVQPQGDRIVADASLLLDRALWDVQFGSDTFFDDLGDDVISDEFSLLVHIEAMTEAEMMEEDDGEAMMEEEA